MPSKTLHVFRSIAGWEVKKEGRQSKTFGTKRDALAMAIHQAKNTRAAQVVVHRRDGRVAELRFFGMPKILKSPRKEPFGGHKDRQGSWQGCHGSPKGRFSHLPRFNMPLELGLFLGCRRFGAGNQRKKSSLILDREPYRYRTFMSDISGQDIHSHAGDPERAIVETRDWLRAASNKGSLAGGAEIVEHCRRFRNDLPNICDALRLDPHSLTFLDLSDTITDWLRMNP